MSLNKNELLKEFSRLAEENIFVPADQYENLQVKKGLRNADGTGVLAGLTVIGNVKGYIIEDGKRLPTEGKLSYRGIDVEDIAVNCIAEKRPGFEEVSYLLLFGNLPDERQLGSFSELLGSMRNLPDNFMEDMILKAPSQNIMNKLARSVLACYSYDPYADDLSIENVFRQSMELIARFGTMIAYAYQAKSHYFDKRSLIIHDPKPHLSTAENFLAMIRPDEKYTPLEAEILDLGLVLHAEHGGGNNSAFAARVVTSSGTDTYSAIAAAVGSLKGPKHGGANAEVMEMMDDIKDHVKDWKDEDEINAYLEKIVRKEANDKSGLIYGMGHAIYTLSDPRAILLKERAEELAKRTGQEEEFNLYKAIERLSPGVFERVKGSTKVIGANVDFYSGFVYKMLNIPPELYTPIFAMSRIVGWCAHRIEELLTCSRIIRPAYKSVVTKREYIKMKNRKA